VSTDPHIGDPHGTPPREADWLGAVQGLIGRSGDLQGAFELVAGVVAARMGPGLALWLDRPEDSGGPTRLRAGCDVAALGSPAAQWLTQLSQHGVPQGTLTNGLDLERAHSVPLASDGCDGLPIGLSGRFQQMLTVPMLSCSGHLGWFRYLACAPSGQPSPELEALGLFVNLFSSQVANHRYVTELQQAKTWIDREIAKIAGIQRALMPDREPPIAGLNAAVSFRAFGDAGGDYYDLVGLPEIGEGFGGTGELPRWGVILADASGHGASAAVEVAMLDAILRTYPGPAAGPAAVLAYANRHLFTRRLRGTFITAFIANYSRSRQRLTYASAGHHPALLRRADPGNDVLALDRDGGMPLLVARDAAWTDVELEMLPGDILVLYTDGIIETRNANGEEFGTQRLERVVGEARPNVQSVVTAIEMAVDDFRDGVQPRDDQTLVVLQVAETGDD
jgi:sigma-B regulation protein RsbU (phosphoserine phosphatase)